MTTWADVLDRTRPLWRKEEFAQILEMLLAEELVPLLSDPQLGMAPREAACRQLVAEALPACRTLGDLLTHPSPPTQLLVWAKDWAKVQRDLKRQVKREGYHRNLPVMLSQGEANGEGTG